MQLHCRFASSAGDDPESVGLVCTSKLRIALSKSESAVEAPCIAVPPDTLTFVLGAGDAVREDCEDAVLRGDSMSETKGPAAEGGAFDVVGVEVDPASPVMSGICVASAGRFSLNARLSATCSLCDCLARDAVGI